MEVINQNPQPASAQHPCSEKPDDFLPWAILATVFCCLPFGIVAIIRSTQVNSYWAQEKYDESIKAAADARKWTYWSAGIAFAVWFIYIFLIVLGVGVAAMC